MAVLVFGSPGTVPIRSTKSTFADNSWQQIIQACQENNIPETWAVGDSKIMEINNAQYLVDIIGKNHDIYSDGTGTAPLTFQLHDLYATEYQLHFSADNKVGWTDCTMRKTHLPSVLALMPAEVQAAIREVNKHTAMPSKTDLQITADKLFLLSETEILGAPSYSAKVEGTQYEYYTTAGNSRKFKGTTADAWWERSPRTNSSYNYCYITATGAPSIAAATAVNPISFAFCF